MRARECEGGRKFEPQHASGGNAPGSQLQSESCETVCEMDGLSRDNDSNSSKYVLDTLQKKRKTEGLGEEEAVDQDQYQDQYEDQDQDQDQDRYRWGGAQTTKCDDTKKEGGNEARFLSMKQFFFLNKCRSDVAWQIGRMITEQTRTR